MKTVGQRRLCRGRSRLLFATIALLSDRAAAFELSSLWGHWLGDDNDSSSPDMYAYPRRDIVEELGEEAYYERLADAMGIDSKNAASVASASSPYGVDVSFPIHHNTVSSTQKQVEYDAYLSGCRVHYGNKGGTCDESEEDRIGMNRRQPQAMQNYTDMGFKKMQAPTELTRLLQTFWETNADRQAVEKWSTGNTHANHWSSPTYMLSLENPSLPGGGPRLKQRVWDAARDILQQWTGHDLTPSSLYGIRIYKAGSVLAPHVDRLPLVSSAIINVAQDVDEPWPLEVHGHDGKAYNITMEPGDMLLYESQSVVHGRPFPLKGDHFASVFIHFEPVGHSLRHEDRMQAIETGGVADHDLFQRAQARTTDSGVPSTGADKSDRAGTNDLPPYIMKGTNEEKRWRQQHLKPRREKRTQSDKDHSVSYPATVTKAHLAAREGDLDTIRAIAAAGDVGMFVVKDEHGWQPLHEAARGGFTEVAEILIEHGADVNARPNNGHGASPLWWLANNNGEDHPMTMLLRKHGGKKIAPFSTEEASVDNDD